MSKHTPHGYVVDKQSGEIIAASSRAIELALEGIAANKKINPIAKRLTEIKEELKALVEPDHVLCVEGLVEVNFNSRKQVVVVDEKALKDALGKRFEDLVITKTEYQPTEKLIEIASDADNPLSEKIRPCLGVKESISVSFKDLESKKRKVA